MSVAQMGISSWAQPAGVDLTGKLFYFATVDSSGNIIVNLASTGPVIGVIIEEATSGNAASVQTDGIAKVQANATIAPGQQIASDGTGQAIVYASGIALGVCLTGGVAGNIITMKLY